MFPHYLKGDTSQGEGLEVSRLPLLRTQDEALLAGADVVLSVAVERTHAGGEPGGKTRSGIKGLQSENAISERRTVPAAVPVGSHLVSGHCDERSGGSSLTDGDLHTLQLRRHLASQEETRSADDVNQSPGTRLCATEDVGGEALFS